MNQLFIILSVMGYMYLGYRYIVIYKRKGTNSWTTSDEDELKKRLRHLQFGTLMIFVAWIAAGIIKKTIA